MCPSEAYAGSSVFGQHDGGQLAPGFPDKETAQVFIIQRSRQRAHSYEIDK